MTIFKKSFMQVRAKKEIIKHKVLGFMNEENRRKIWKLIQEAGLYLRS